MDEAPKADKPESPYEPEIIARLFFWFCIYFGPQFLFLAMGPFALLGFYVFPAGIGYLLDQSTDRYPHPSTGSGSGSVSSTPLVLGYGIFLFHLAFTLGVRTKKYFKIMLIILVVLMVLNIAGCCGIWMKVGHDLDHTHM